jgi:hypothetical protein
VCFRLLIQTTYKSLVSTDVNGIIMMLTGLRLDVSCTADDITDLHVHRTTFLLVLQCVHVVIISVFLRRVFCDIIN